MAETINMPKLGFDMAEGVLVRWVKQIGEDINKGDVLAEIETDKATVEVESSASGVVLQQIVDEGAVVSLSLGGRTNLHARICMDRRCRNIKCEENGEQTQTAYTGT